MQIELMLNKNIQYTPLHSIQYERALEIVGSSIGNSIANSITIGRKYMKTNMKQLHFRFVNKLIEAPGTLPDLPGWILGQSKTNQNFVKKRPPSVCQPTRLRRSLFASTGALNSIFSTE